MKHPPCCFAAPPSLAFGRRGAHPAAWQSQFRGCPGMACSAAIRWVGSRQFHGAALWRIEMTGVPIPRPTKKPPCGGFFIGAGLKTRAVRLLLGSSVSSSLGSVSGSLGSVASGVGSVSSSTGDGTSSRTHGSAGSGSSVGHSSSGGSGCFCRSGSSHGSGCGCRSGFFLLATSGQSSGSNQSGEYERLIHFRFP